MTEKELRDDIIVKMLDYRDESNVDLNEFYEAKKITFSSNNQKERIFEYLHDREFIEGSLYRDGDGYFSITSKGVNYAEKLLARKYITPTSISNYYHESKNKEKDITSKSYTALENKTKIIDNNVEACFDVEYLAECYVDLIDRACEHGENNVCMFGIFAPWGRGKSYFFRKLKNVIDLREGTEEAEDIKYINEIKTIHYDIVEFNAWKYQETPAIWAYLFETLYNGKKVWDKNWWSKKKYNIKRNLKSILSETLFCLSPTLIAGLSTLLLKYTRSIDDVLIGTSVAGLISIIGLILNFIRKDYNSAISLIKKYSKGISFANELGVQAEIEKEITSLLKFWIKEEETDNRKIILYIDDIDRCSETKMTSIIDSLRFVLENKEIRKRLIIICSIDPEKIIKGIEYKYQTLYNQKELRSIAIDQMDKIFLTGIALSPLDNDQIYEFASKLAGVRDTSINFNSQIAQIVENRYKIITNFQEQKRRYHSDLDLTDSEIYYQLKNLIKDNKKQLTPRKIRIIYYRILLANNIISRKENPKITKHLIKNIFELSVGTESSNSNNSEELSDILNMVVPYKYKEENKVEENKVEEDKENEVAS